MNGESAEAAVRRLTEAFARLGAAPESAQTMAAQLWKRAGQLAAERGTAVEDELAYLLAGVAEARRGQLSAAYNQRRPPRPPAN